MPIATTSQTESTSQEPTNKKFEVNHFSSCIKNASDLRDMLIAWIASMFALLK
jgi:hypothetical protein